MNAISEAAANGIEQQLLAITVSGGLPDAMEAMFSILDKCLEFAYSEGVDPRELSELLIARVAALDTIADRDEAAERAETEDDGA